MPTEVTDLTEIVTQAIEAVGAIASGIQSMKILDLSKDYYNLYNAQKTYYYNTFRTRAEQALSTAIYNKPQYTLDYLSRVESGLLGPSPLGNVSDNIVNWQTRHANMYGDTPDSGITSMEADIATLEIDWANYLMRFEEVYVDLENDIRWQERLMVHNIGIQQGVSVSSAMDGSLSLYQDHIKDMSNILASYGNGFARYAGYKKGLMDVKDAHVFGSTFVGNLEVIKDSLHGGTTSTSQATSGLATYQPLIAQHTRTVDY